MYLLNALVRHNGSLAFVHRSEREAVRDISSERSSHEAQGDIKRKQVFRGIPLLVKLAANHACEIAEAINAKHE